MAYGNCQTCQYFIAAGGKTECRRYPPGVHVLVDGRNNRPILNACVWPHVDASAGCGEYRQTGQDAEARPIKITEVEVMPNLTISASPSVTFGGALGINILSGGI